jgi:hypothetical protein
MDCGTAGNQPSPEPESGELPNCVAQAGSPENGAANPKGFKIDFGKELLITNPAIVDDACRTTWSGVDEQGQTCPPGTVGHWTFGYLMKQMAGTVPVGEFSKKWVDTFLNAQTIDTETILPRQNATLMSASAWGTGGYPAEYAPFRLLAIANRVDLESTDVPTTNIYRGGFGEGRLVFGVLSPDGRKLRAAVIFEYRLPARANLGSAAQWAAEWHKLNTLSGDAYKKQLQILTDAFVDPLGAGRGPNGGSNIAHVRTNELAFDASASAQWEMRSYTLQESTGGDCGPSSTTCMLKLSDLANTPPKTLNNTAALAGFLYSNASGILAQTASFPKTLFYSGMTYPMQSNSVRLQGMNLSEVWRFPEAVGSQFDYKTLRQRFAFGTCNGCHYNETQTDNLHIQEREPKQESPLSNFVKNKNLTDPKAQDFADPGSSNQVASRLGLNEPRRRACEMIRLLHGSSKRFAPLNNAVRF